MIGKIISHYRIVEQLGEGGMGEVYKAEDIKLKRTVALKFLHPELTREEEAKTRFIHEARAASALEHPNICTVFEIDQTSEGQSFIAMSYCEGETLKNRIERGPLILDHAINIAIQCCRGLTKAHEKSIIHRDIKSANIMIAGDDQVKIVDFGLAKLSGKTQLTMEGSTLGTIAFMSPEQARGEVVDHRTDIWSLGVVLYEMITGQLPFKGEYEQAVVHSIINEMPDALTGLRTAVPLELERIVNKCLEKDPADRYQHMDELIVDLRHLKKDSDSKKTSLYKMDRKISLKTLSRRFLWPGVFLITLITFISVYFLWVVEVESKERIPVAVVDFVNETDEQELDGLSGMLITALEQSHRLNVLTRSRMFDILEQLGMENIERIDESTGREICREANINMLAIATIRKFGEIYTIDFKVLEVEKNEYLFTTMEKGEGQESIPALIDNLSDKTREGLKEKLAEIEATSRKIAQVTTPNLEAYQHYFKGEEYINKLQFSEAEKEFNKAIRLDTTFGLAYYRLAYAINWEQDAESARKYIQKAMKLLDRIPEKEKYLVRAEYLNIEESFGNGLAVLIDMEKKYPDNKEMIYNIGDWSWHLGDYSTAKTYLEKVLESDPKFERALQHLIWIYRDMGYYEKMLDIAKRYVAVASSSESFELLIEAYIYLQDFETGLRTIRKIQERFPDNYELIPVIANILIQMEKYEQAETELKILIQDDKSTEERQVGYESLVRFYPYMGKYQTLFEIIDKQTVSARQNNDSLRVAYLQVLKVLYLQRKFNDISIDWEEVTETLRIQRKIKSTLYWATMSLLYLYHGDYELADSVTRSISSTWWYFTIRSCIYSRKHECQKAKFYADSVIHAGPGFCKIQALYSLAQCQYNMEKYDRAEKSLLLLQGIRDQSFGFRSVYYPKSYYLLARVYEKKGQFAFAIKNYQKFLTLWKDGDQDLPELIDAKKRLAILESKKNRS
jgi:serine/threonine protein kinase/tetratricopeptide (TPR) repeat protein